MKSIQISDYIQVTKEPVKAILQEDEPIPGVSVYESECAVFALSSSSAVSEVLRERFVRAFVYKAP